MGSARLREVLTRIQDSLAAGQLPIVVFDLDSTLFTTSPRNLRILREFALARAARWPEIESLVSTLAAGDMGWGVDECLRSRGIADEALLRDLRGFWYQRFFTDAYLADDLPVPGAAEFVSACHDMGAMIYYLTGRHVGGMEIGTVRALTEHGFPYWRGRCVLHLKPSFEMSDRGFKDDALADVRSYQGRVVATFENEPGNANAFLRAFPEALHFLLRTIHSPRAPAADPGLVPSDDFRLPD
jgi:hypothetical protein